MFKRASAFALTAVVAGAATWVATRPQTPTFVAAAVAVATPTTTSTTVAPPPPAPTPALAPPFTVAAPRSAGAQVSVYDAPGGRVIQALSQHDTLPAVFLVKSTADGGWLEVWLPTRPNGSTGFIRASEVTLTVVSTQIKIDLGARHLTAWNGDQVIADEPVGVGTDSSPTPTGTFYIQQPVATGNPGGAYGPYILALSAHSDVYKTFGGGDGLVGIHGTNSAGSIGNPVSHGCVRMSNATISKLAKELPPGTPVVIVP